MSESFSKCFPFLSKFYYTRPFGKRPSDEGYSNNYHTGIDMQPCNSNGAVPSSGAILTAEEKTIVAVTSGVVMLAQFQKSYGNFVWVKNDDGTGAIYCHMSKFYCKVGDKVTCKTELGEVGTTGNSSAIHLHLGISKYDDYYTTHQVGQSSWIDPVLYLCDTWDGSTWKQVNGAGMITGVSGAFVSGFTHSSGKFESVNAANNTSSRIASSIVASGEYYQIENLAGVTTDWLFGRKCRVLIVLKDRDTLDVSEVRCKFNIVKSCYNEQNISTVELYNLSPDTENKIIREGASIIIEAGYVGSQYGKIFSGGIIQPLRSKDGQVDYKLTLVSVDSDRYVQYGIVGVTLTAEQSQRDAVGACINKAGQITKQNYDISAGYIADTSLKYPRGKVLFGKPMDLMDQIARSNNMSLYTDDGEVNIVAAEGISKNEIYDLSPSSGLIGTPSQNEYGIKAECLLNPNITLNSLVHIQNTKIAGLQYTPGKVVRSLDTEGIYRVIKLTYSGDTRGEDWKVSFEAIGQAGQLPAMLVGDAVYTG